MSAAPSPSDRTRLPPGAAGLQPVRAHGRVSVGFKHENGRTRLASLSEADGYRVKFPRTAGPAEAVIINTGGGMAGGDSLEASISCGDAARAVISTQSAEKIYRCEADETAVSVRIDVAAGAALDWLPQETILFSGARLKRTLEVSMQVSSRLLIAEAIIFGRVHSGEILGEGSIRDTWRIRRDGKLIFADNLALRGNLAELMARPAVGGGARAIATVLLIGAGAEAQLETARSSLACGPGLAGSGVASGASAWNGMLIIRFAAADPALLRQAMANTLNAIRDEPLPRVWHC